MWSLEQEEYYLRILDPKKQIAGYFDPDYGEIHPKEKEEEIIERMWKSHDPIPGGYMMLGMVKFGIFDHDYNSDLPRLESQLDAAMRRLGEWKEAIRAEGITAHTVNISHTDQDMLTISFPVAFAQPPPLDRKKICARLEPILNRMHERRLI